jgi:hypothetical protein
MESAFEIEGPLPAFAEIWAWSNFYIPFDNPSADARALRSELQDRLRKLRPQTGELLFASFAGPKHPRCDIENLLLYNIGSSISSAAANGVCFELAPGHHSQSPSGRTWTTSYHYSLARGGNEFTHWRVVRNLATFESVDLHSFAGSKRLAQTWLALHRAPVATDTTWLAPDRLFAVRLQLQGPGRVVASAELVKSVIDGVVCAFQCHQDQASLSAVAEMLARALSASAQEIAAALSNDRRAVLGNVDRLVYPYRGDVKWDPSDHRCVAGEVRTSTSTTRLWTLSGSVDEVEARLR